MSEKKNNNKGKKNADNEGQLQENVQVPQPLVHQEPQPLVHQDQGTSAVVPVFVQQPIPVQYSVQQTAQMQCQQLQEKQSLAEFWKPLGQNNAVRIKVYNGYLVLEKVMRTSEGWERKDSILLSHALLEYLYAKMPYILCILEQIKQR